MIVQAISFFAYVRAFAPAEGGDRVTLDGALVVVALAIAPLSFFAVGRISKSRDLLRKVVMASALLLAIGLSLGLLNPLIAAGAGFGTGFALTLSKPDIDGQLRRRLVAVLIGTVYMVVVSLWIATAGVLAAAVVPALSVGFADEYGAWHEARTGA